MTLEEQVVSLELAKRLKELGAEQESYCYWIFDNTHTSSLRVSDGDKLHHKWKVMPKFDDYELFQRKRDEDKVSAFTVAELGKMLPAGFQSSATEQPTSKALIHKFEWHAWRWNFKPSFFADTEPDARAKMLIYLIENGLVGYKRDAQAPA